MGTDIEINDHTDDFTDEFYAAVFRGLEKIGITAEAYAKLALSTPKEHKDKEKTVRPNVDTGRLRNSITHAIGTDRGKETYTDDKGHAYTGGAARAAPEDNTVYIGTNVEYAAYVEMGTSRSKAYPFLQPAIENHKDEYIRLLMDEL